MTGNTGSLRYMSPEVVNHHTYNYKVDVYSFGIVLWEILSDKKAFQGMTEEQFLLLVVAGNKRPTMNKTWPKEVIDLMKKCWDADMRRRPAFSKIIRVLDEVLVDLERKKIINGHPYRPSLTFNRPALLRRNSMPSRMVFKSLHSFERRNSDIKTEYF